MSASRSWSKDLAALALLALALVLTYHSSLTQLYLFADETWLFAAHVIKRSVADAILAYTSSYGRPIAGPLILLLGKGIHLGGLGLEIIRWLQLLASLCIASVAFGLLRRQGLQRKTALLLTLFMWSQPAFAIFHAYSILMPYWLGVACSLLAFYLVTYRSRAWGLPLTLLLAFGLFLVALLTYQASVFFCAGFLALAVLMDKPGADRKPHFALFATLMTAFASYVLFYYLSKSFLGYFTYRGGAQTGLSPDMLRIFEFWNYPFPLPVSEAGVLLACTAVALAWALLLAMTAWREWQEDKGAVLRWALAMACVAASFIPVIADGGGARQHLFLTAIPALVLSAWYAANGLLADAGEQNALMRALPVLVVLTLLAGASAGYSRGIVEPAARMLTFIHDQAQADGQAPRKLTVLVPPQRIWRELCPAQPCGGFYGRRFQLRFHLTRPSYYKTAFRLRGSRNLRSVLFVDTLEDAPTGQAIIDWPEYLAQEARAGRVNDTGF